LDGKEWVKRTKSWFVVNPPPRSKSQIEHPAKFPQKLVDRFVELFTRESAWVIDPFAGVGSTLVSCRRLKRNAVGIELNEEFAAVANDDLLKQKGSGHQIMMVGDSREAPHLLENQFDGSPPAFDLLVTSPPYWNMLSKSRGGNATAHKERAEQGLKQTYSKSELDLGNLDVYDEYLAEIVGVLEAIRTFLKEGAYLVIVAQNMRDTDGQLRPIAWDLARNLSQTYELRQEQIWCQDNKRLGCWGFPTTYVSNVHHHYCLVLQKRQ
jgi:DNA modification methylase